MHNNYEREREKKGENINEFIMREIFSPSYYLNYNIAC